MQALHPGVLSSLASAKVDHGSFGKRLSMAQCAAMLSFDHAEGQSGGVCAYGSAGVVSKPVETRLFGANSL
jgi:hypothetical protein